MKADIVVKMGFDLGQHDVVHHLIIVCESCSPSLCIPTKLANNLHSFTAMGEVRNNET